MFSFRRSALAEIDRLFAENGGDGDVPTLMAWRAQIAVIEQFSEDPERASARGREFAARAFEAAPTNSMVLSMASNVRVLLDWRTDDAGELALQSVRINPCNPFAWWSCANVALHAGRAEMAMKAAERGAVPVPVLVRFPGRTFRLAFRRSRPRPPGP